MPKITIQYQQAGDAHEGEVTLPTGEANLVKKALEGILESEVKAGRIKFSLDHVIVAKVQFPKELFGGEETWVRDPHEHFDSENWSYFF